MMPRTSPRNSPAHRLVGEETGMALGLAVVVVVVVGVMGAGLLTFVVTDLSAVAGVNKGQRAFEMAEAGVGVAERQIVSVPEAGRYDGGADDVRWSARRSADPAERGVTLVDLDGASETDDSVGVTVEAEGANAFEVVSTGRYGDAARKIEATFSVGPDGPELRSWRELYE